MLINKETVKKLREEMQMTQIDFATMLGVSRVLIGQIERGEKPVSKAMQIIITNTIKNRNTNYPTNDHYSLLVAEEQVIYNNNSNQILKDKYIKALEENNSLKSQNLILQKKLIECENGLTSKAI